MVGQHCQHVLDSPTLRAGEALLVIVCGRGNLCTMHCVPQNCDCGGLLQVLLHILRGLEARCLCFARVVRALLAALLAVVETHVEKAAWDSLAC